MLNNWNVFDQWSYKKDLKENLLNWQAFDQLFPFHKSIIEGQYKVLQPLLKRWNKKLSVLEGEPTFKDWNQFRPLRLSREEDWADWLAYLIETSTTGTFSENLLGSDVSKSLELPKQVLREDICKGYRADMIIEWQDKKFTHIEVKIGDPNLKKTYPTSEVFREKFDISEPNWSNFILLLSYQLPEWEMISESKSHTTEIKPITWVDVCIALRNALVSNETLLWKAWAYPYLGAVEQLLVGFKGHQLNYGKKPRENVDKKIFILENSLTHE